MKVLYLETKNKQNQQIQPSSNLDFSMLPKTLLLVYSIQYKSLAQEIKTQLSKQGFKITGFQQVLGCTKLASKNAILLIGSGQFHAVNLAVQNNVAIYIYENQMIKKLDQKLVEELKAKKQGAYSKFLNAHSLGIIVTTKPGQENLKKALILRQKIQIKYPTKQVFIFLASNINLNELENFQVDYWVNSACPGLFYDTSKMINIDDILDFLS